VCGQDQPVHSYWEKFIKQERTWPGLYTHFRLRGNFSSSTYNILISMAGDNQGHTQDSHRKTGVPTTELDGARRLSGVVYRAELDGAHIEVVFIGTVLTEESSSACSKVGWRPQQRWIVLRTVLGVAL
jgi:hypothetical protein